MVFPHYTDDKTDAFATQRDLFVSQLARKHPVPLFQFLDICARSGQLDAVTAISLVSLVTHAAAKIGTKGLADLLDDSAATAALGSALCSTRKLWTAPGAQCNDVISAASAKNVSGVWPAGVINFLQSVVIA